MHLLFQTTRPLGSDTGAGDDDVGPVGQAIRMASYYLMLVDAILTLVDFDELVERLRDDCQPDIGDATKDVYEKILRDNERYQELNRMMEAYKKSYGTRRMRHAGSTKTK